MVIFLWCRPARSRCKYGCVCCSLNHCVFVYHSLNQSCNCSVTSSNNLMSILQYVLSTFCMFSMCNIQATKFKMFCSIQAAQEAGQKFAQKSAALAGPPATAPAVQEALKGPAKPSQQGPTASKKKSSAPMPPMPTLAQQKVHYPLLLCCVTNIIFCYLSCLRV